MGGFGGALKNISIGIASSHGKAHIHGAGVPEEIWTADHDSFLESMADAAQTIVNYYQENIVFIKVHLWRFRSEHPLHVACVRPEKH